MKLPSIFSQLLSTYFRWTAAGVVVIILGLGYWLFLGQQLDALKTTSLAERTRTETQLKQRQAYLAALRSSIQAFQQRLPQSALTAIDDFLPSQPDFPGLLVTIRNIAGAANVDLQSLTISDGGATAGASAAAGSATEGAASTTVSSFNLKTEDASVVVSGGSSYEDFKRFLAVVESSRRLMDIQSLSFGVSQSSSASAQNYSLTLRTYYQPTQ